jgi:HK97 family phage major capsid protein
MSRNTNDVESPAAQITASLRGLGEELKTYRAERENAEAELNARMQSLEQHVAGKSAGGSGSGAYPSVGARAAMSLAEDAGFQAAAEAASRGMKVGRIESRVNIDSSIRAALVGDTPGAGDTGIKSSPERREVISGLRSLRLIEALPKRPVSSDAVEVVLVTATGDAAEQEKQGDAKADIDVSGEPRTLHIATVAAWTAASKQVLGDHAALQAQIDTLIRHKVLSRLENRIVNGTGGQGKINGLLNQALAFTPTIGTTPADIIGESMVRQANAGYMPGIVLLNPMDWFRIQITKKQTEDEYIFGSPTMPVPPALWNSAVVASPSVPEGSGMTIDPGFVTVLDREQLSVVVSNSHADFFVRNLVAILAELRAGLEVLDASAVYKFSLNTVTP